MFSWRKNIILSILFLFASCSQAEVTNHSICDKQESLAIKKVILGFINKQSAVAPGDVSILSLKCVSSYASAIIHPKKPITDDAMVYLKKTGHHWTVINLGTGFDEEFLVSLPKELRTIN